MAEGTLFSSNLSTLFAEVALPVPIDKLFTYRVPAAIADRVKRGQRVIVPFGQKKILTGIIATLHTKPPKEYEAKPILELLDETEIIYDHQFSLYEWIAQYYMCTLGEVLQAALPSGLKLSSESMIQLRPDFVLENSSFDFSEKERLLLDRLKAEVLSYTEAAKLLEARSIYHILKSLSSKEAIILFEEVKEKYKPKTERRIRLHKNYADKKALETLFEKLAAKPKQEAVVLHYLQHVPVFNNQKLNEQGLRKLLLLKSDVSESSINTLVKQKILEEFEVIVPRFGFPDSHHLPPVMLNEAQEAARNQILAAFQNQEVVLLHGVTGSGKTEIYIDLVRKALEGGSQALLLLPEIAITTQIVLRLKKMFGSEMGVYHSRFSDNERVEVWNGVLTGKFRFVVGVRSAVFLPFDNLGLIIVDEEHDASYKQQDPAPRYQARDVAQVIARQHHAKVVLGSATPSLESYYHALQGRYGYVQLTQRFGNAQLPAIVFADVTQERKSKTIKGDFTATLIRSINATLEKSEQVILFQNRRGYSPLVQCEDCQWVPKCINCAVSLTYHQYRHALVCHYCGYREDLPTQCPTCSSKRILTLGYGTEKLEEELKFHFPNAQVQRMDLDTTRSRSGYETIIEAFEKGETQILVGTQMVTKGLDFDRVSLVGVFDTDRMIHFPDFRSYERAFQLIMQVSGRAGRRETTGTVILQTANPKHELFRYIATNNVTGFLNDQLHDRQTHLYPPFTRLIDITLKHTDKKVVTAAATQLVNVLRKELPATKIMGPGEPMISKIRNEFLMLVLLKIKRDQGKLPEVKQIILQTAARLQQVKEYRSVKVVFDVDPV
ncbi:MAG: primosomal protein N' [Cyclobacteriaceae bacterium]|nr:primosomal protein N' [Cyclobacteriaceae bacterium]